MKPILCLLMLLGIPVGAVVWDEKIPVEINRPIYAETWYDTIRIQFRGWHQVPNDLELIERIPDRHGFLDSLVLRKLERNPFLDDSAYCQPITYKMKVVTPPILRWELDTLWLPWHPPMAYEDEWRTE